VLTWWYISTSPALRLHAFSTKLVWASSSIHSVGRVLLAYL